LWVNGACAQTYNQMTWGFTLPSGSPYNFGANIQGNWYNLGTVSSAGAWTLTPSIINVTNAGAFDNTQQYDYVVSNVGNINIGQFFSSFWGGYHATEALVGAVIEPTTATNLQSNAVSGYSDCAKDWTGISPRGGCVSGFFVARASGNGANLFGINTWNGDAGITNVTEQNEFDFDSRNASTIVSGSVAFLSGTIQPSSAVAWTCNATTGLKWGACLFSRDGQVYRGAYFGTRAVGNGVDSQEIAFNGIDAGGVNRTALIFGSQYGNINLRSGQNNFPVVIQDYNNGNGSNIAYFGATASFISSPLTVNGTAIFNSGINVGAAVGVSCSAGTVNTSTMVITNGIVTHC